MTSIAASTPPTPVTPQKQQQLQLQAMLASPQHLSNIELIVSKELQKSPNFVKLGFQFLGPELAKYLAYNVLNSPQCTVTYLDLSGNMLGDDGAVLIAEALKTNTSVQYLNLSMNDISSGAKAILKTVFEQEEGASFNTTLQHLDLSMNRLGFEGFDFICQMLQRKHVLVTLSLRSNRVTSKDAVTKMLEILALREQSQTLKEGTHTSVILNKLHTKFLFFLKNHITVFI